MREMPEPWLVSARQIHELVEGPRRSGRRDGRSSGLPRKAPWVDPYAESVQIVGIQEVASKHPGHRFWLVPMWQVTLPCSRAQHRQTLQRQAGVIVTFESRSRRVRKVLQVSPAIINWRG